MKHALLLLTLFALPAHANYQCQITAMAHPSHDGESIQQSQMIFQTIQRNFTVNDRGEIRGAYPTTGYDHQVIESAEGYHVIANRQEDGIPLFQAIEIYQEVSDYTFHRYISTVGTLLTGRCHKTA